MSHLHVVLTNITKIQISIGSIMVKRWTLLLTDIHSIVIEIASLFMMSLELMKDSTPVHMSKHLVLLLPSVLDV